MIPHQLATGIGVLLRERCTPAELARPKSRSARQATGQQLLAVWGENDPAFIPAGAFAYQRDIPDAEVHLLNTGHFALETHSREVAGSIDDFLSRKLQPGRA